MQLALFPEPEPVKWWLLRDPCRWNPEEQGVTIGVDEHAEAEVIVQVPDDDPRWRPFGELRLCRSCASRPEFKGRDQQAIRVEREGGEG